MQTNSNTLARWCQTLFEGNILSDQSMWEMLMFEKFSSVANMRACGLGVELYTLSFAQGKDAIGHGGGNIGTTTYRVYFPEYQISLVTMINAFPNYGADTITKGLIKIALSQLNAIGLIPYFEFFPTGLMIISIFSILISISVFTFRKLNR